MTEMQPIEARPLVLRIKDVRKLYGDLEAIRNVSLEPADKLYTDQFAGGVTLTPDEWTQVEARVKKELPSTVS